MVITMDDPKLGWSPKKKKKWDKIIHVRPPKRSSRESDSNFKKRIQNFINNNILNRQEEFTHVYYDGAIIILFPLVAALSDKIWVKPIHIPWSEESFIRWDPI
jgi:hypothetical protein